VLLDGAATDVRWTDGDTFRILSGSLRGRSARLEGYNTLETYGPVHRWGTWSSAELLEIAHAASRFARSATWECTARGEEDRYKRLLVYCPRAAAELVRRGLAMVYAVGRPADPQLLGLQRDAQRRGSGMWAKGVPREIVTSVHSAVEGSGRSYDRVVDTATGLTRERSHRASHAICQLVCHGAGADRSCMRYVPFERRYRHRPWCLRASHATRLDP
jgi:endonuclease YncB( thermonuclease family)